jgi:hypothetical protein
MLSDRISNFAGYYRFGRAEAITRSPRFPHEFSAMSRCRFVSANSQAPL